MYSGDVYESHMRHGTGNSLQVILKVTERCNIACTYCYFFFGGDESYADNPAFIGEQTADHFVRFVEEARQRYHLDQIRIILHGGEPLMLKKSRMRRLLERLRQASEGTLLRFTVQTNAMLVDEEWLQIFEELQVYVGVSLDGPGDLNDRYRVDKKGRGTYERVMKGVEKLFAAYEAGRIARPGLLCVMNPEFPAEEVYRHFIEEIGFRNVDFLLPDDHHDSMSEEQREVFTSYVGELVSLYLQEERSGVRFRLVDKALAAFGVSPSFHSMMYRFVMQKEVTITVTSAGDVSPDDILRTTDPELMTTGLNVATASLTDVIEAPELGHLQDAFYSIPTGCRDCEWASVCRGGELYHRFGNGRAFDNPSVYCDALKVLHEKVAEACLLAGMDYELMERRLASAPLPLTTQAPERLPIAGGSAEVDDVPAAAG